MSEERIQDLERQLVELRTAAVRMQRQRDVWSTAAMRALDRDRVQHEAEITPRGAAETLPIAATPKRKYTADETIASLRATADVAAGRRARIARLYELAAARQFGPVCGECGAVIGGLSALEFPPLLSSCTPGQCGVCGRAGPVSPSWNWIGPLTSESDMSFGSGADPYGLDEAMAKLVAIAQRLVSESGQPDVLEKFDAAAWVHGFILRPHRALGGQRPLDLIGTPDGFDLVVNLLLQQHYGVYM